jgi:N-acetylmuramoyl-L-alanine amidase
MHHAKVTRRGLLMGGGATAGLVAAGVPSATWASGGLAPRVYTTQEWGARPPNGTITVLDRQPDHIVVHHAVTVNTPDFSQAQAFAFSHWIQELHMDANGWGDSGQQLTISRGGYVMEGRHQSLQAIRERRHVRGAQTAGHNDHTIGIENEGLYMSAPVPRPLFSSLVQTCAWLCDVYQLDPFEAIVGHRDYVSTTICPGDSLYGRLPDLRQQVAQLLAS